ncbi:HK97 gp10 family phage protein [Rossellomorea vietnamensis]|uniref:HK97 gp10 family phage protein n=1 Tax=Rossellomorea vietnamensis TaxID=218284 RepID=A0A5D4M2G4_9BACI|nr:HK97 gp10 family phage protein [Rossellomorea vietnamensis]TYR95721.1 HK97 gp10 family phage protein [Rossellomorea vietnamensis]
MKIKTDLAEQGRRLAEEFAAESIRIESKVEAELYKGAQKVHARAVQLVPVGEYPAGSGKSGGQLKNSLAIRQTGWGSNPSFEVGSKVPYAMRIEYGFRGTDSLGRTYNQAPQPYLNPALNQYRGFIYNQVLNVIKLGL